MFFSRQILSAALALVAGTASHAAPVAVFYGFDSAPSHSVVGTNSLSQRVSFLQQFTGPGATSFGFERPDVRVGTTTLPLVVNFGDAMATVTAGSGTFMGVGELGRFNTTDGGSQYLRVQAGTSNFKITFDKDISAFGFYATDVGDFEGTLKLLLRDVADNLIDTLTIRDQSANPNLSGSLLFYGFADRNVAYRSVTFQSSGSNDFFGFDDFVVGTRNQLLAGTIPEPASLALVGLALCAVGVARKSNRPA